jgi:Chitobiase/beta-hexosaminidase C-terminal domain
MNHTSARVSASARPHAPHRRLGKLSALGVLSAAVATAGLFLPADAAVTDPHTVVVLKNDSIVEVEGLAAGEAISVEVRRNGVLVGSVAGNASDPGGTFIINHDLCWDNFTPEILPGDVVTVATASSAVADTVRVRNVHVRQGPVLSGTRFTIRGVVRGPRIPVGQLQVEARTNDPIRFRPLAPGTEDGVTGTIRYDRATGGAFTATFTGLNREQRQAVPNFGEFFVSHVAGTSADGEPKEVTMASEGSPVPGPGCSVDAPLGRHAVTNVSMPVVNQNNVTRSLTVRGTSMDATQVSVQLRDGDGTVVTGAATTNRAAGRQRWEATFASRRLRALSGTVRVAGTYTVDGVRIGGSTMTMLKDLVAPRRPSASPRGGTYRRAQSVRLRSQPGTTIRYTLGRGRQAAPRARTGSLYRGRPVRITASQVLKAVAVDRAGNVSRVLRQRYRIGR